MNDASVPTDAAEMGWIIMAPANIARKNIRAMKSVLAVAGRNEEKAKVFLKENWDKNCENTSGGASYLPYDGVDDFVKNLREHANVTPAFYVPLPVLPKHSMCLNLLEKGYHILLEKPVAKSLEQAEVLVKMSEKQGCVFMDGTMFMHHTRFQKVFEKLRERAMRVTPGHTCRIVVESNFSFNGNDDFMKNNIRMTGGDPAGCLGDLGHYCIRAAVMALAAIRCDSQSIAAHEGRCGTWYGHSMVLDTPVRYEAMTSSLRNCTARVTWEQCVLNFTCSFEEAFTQDLTIKFMETDPSKGDMVIKMDDFVIPNIPEVASFEIIDHANDGALSDFDRRVAKTTTKVATDGCTQERSMFECFEALARGGAKITPEQSKERIFFRQVALMTQRIQDSIEGSFKK